ncbi:MAG: hypothetical protein R2788_21195 [Saprospiraceae bacterium]
MQQFSGIFFLLLGGWYFSSRFFSDKASIKEKKMADRRGHFMSVAVIRRRPLHHKGELARLVGLDDPGIGHQPPGR